jgi:hypothetical protein
MMKSGYPRGVQVEPGDVVQTDYWCHGSGVTLFRGYTVNKRFRLEADLILHR